MDHHHGSSFLLHIYVCSNRLTQAQVARTLVLVISVYRSWYSGSYDRVYCDSQISNINCKLSKRLILLKSEVNLFKHYWSDGIYLWIFIQYFSLDILHEILGFSVQTRENSEIEKSWFQCKITLNIILLWTGSKSC